VLIALWKAGSVANDDREGKTLWRQLHVSGRGPANTTPDKPPQAPAMIEAPATRPRGQWAACVATSRPGSSARMEAARGVPKEITAENARE